MEPSVIHDVSLAATQAPIVTQTCRLRFPDGQVVTGRIQAASPYQECLVAYAGPAHRLPMKCERADSVLLRALFQSFARELRARFEEELAGDWERFAETEEPAEEVQVSVGALTGYAGQKRRRPGSGG